MSEIAKAGLSNKDILEKGRAYLHISVNNILYVLLCYIMSGCEFFGEMVPFGISAYGAAFGPRWPVCFGACLMGMLAGGLGFGSAVYICTLILATIIMGLVVTNVKFRAFCSGASFFVIKACFFVLTDFYWYDILMTAIESVIIWLGVYIFSTALPLIINSKERSCVFDTEIVTVYLFFAIIVKYASGIPLILGMDASVVLAIVLLFIINLDGSISAGSAMGILFGLVAGGKSDSVTSSIGAFALASFGAGLLKRYGKWGVVLGFVTVNTALAAFVPDEVISFDIFEIVAASVIFAVLPHSITSYISGLSAKTVHAATESLLEHSRIQKLVHKKLKTLSDSFDTLAGAYICETKPPSGKYIINMLDTASSKICPGCGLKYNCWERGYKDSYKAMLSMLEVADKKGYIAPADVPEVLSQKCIKLDEFVASFNRMYEIYRVEKIWQNRLNECRMLVSGQLGAVSESISIISEEVDMCVDIAAEKELRMHLDKGGFKTEEITFLKDKQYGFTAEILFDKWNISKKEENEISAIIADITGVKAKCVSKDYVKNGVVLTYKPEAEYSVSVGSAVLSRDGEEVCGDSFVTLETINGEFVAAISDGMGTGARAAAESMTATGLLQNFLRAGVRISTALELINSALLLRSSGESFATMDVCALRLGDGCVALYKSGAASSYIITDKAALRVDSDSLPFGVVEDYGEIKSRIYTVDKSALVVMMSDGVFDALTRESDTCVEDIVRSIDTTNPQVIASAIIKKAVESTANKVEDDMTVLVINIWRK